MRVLLVVHQPVLQSSVGWLRVLLVVYPTFLSLQLAVRLGEGTWGEGKKKREEVG